MKQDMIVILDLGSHENTVLMISLDTFARNSYGSCAQSAVMASVEVTARKATVFS